MEFQRNSTTAYHAWFAHWINVAENTEKPVYFFRFEDILTNPEEELRNLFKFILGVESIEGTVVEQRIKDVLAMGKKKVQTYKPRQGGTNKNLANYLPEQIEFTKRYNEELFHIFGYVKDDINNANSHTGYLDFNGTAKPENVAKINYFRTLNQRAIEKRKAIRHGEVARPENKINVGSGMDGGMSMISHLNIMNLSGVIDHL